MSNWKSPTVPGHLPWFFTSPGQTDGLFIAMVVFVVVVLLLIGILYFKLLGLPERIARRRVQAEIVAVLAVLALFSPGHLFWIAALLLALVELPDFWTPINTIAQSLQTLAGGRRMISQPEASAESTRDATQPPWIDGERLAPTAQTEARALGPEG